MRSYFIGFLMYSLVSLGSLQIVYAQETVAYKDTLRLMFYNVENLFDPFDDSLTRDDEFTKEGERHWNYGKFKTKLTHIYKTMMAVGNPMPPAIVGLCEIENRFVLNQLVYKTPFAKFDYRIVHEESPDRRGIDVALLFDPKRFRLLYHETVFIQFPFNPDSRTRDILYVKGVIFETDTIHLFVNHWPSRWGGQMATDPKRKYVADVLKHKADSLFIAEKNPNIIIMGDFNDYPSDESLSVHLQAGSLGDSTNLVNLMLPYSDRFDMGSHKYQQEWGTLDQIIVSKFLLLPNSPLKIKNKEAKIFNASYLLIPDEKFLGIKPFRTYVGYKYVGGYSDHLPVFFDVYK